MARVRFAFRSLMKARLLSLIVILSLSLGIGANTAIFSLMHQILLHSLPVQRPQDLVVLTSPEEFKGGSSRTGDSGGMDHIFSYPLFRELEKKPQGVTGVAAFYQFGANFSFQKQTVPDMVMVVSGAYFPILGVRPHLGRTIDAADDMGSGNPVAVLSYGYWWDHLGGETSVLNQTLKVNGRTFTIVGVAPKGFTSATLGEEPAAFVPLTFKPLLTPHWNGTDRWNDYYLYLFARLKPGATRQQAAAALNSTYAGLLEEQSKKAGFFYQKKIQRFLHSRLTLKDGSQGQSSLRDDTRMPLIILMCATGMVLLIAMANAANLLLARSAQRRREMAIRSAMGAGPTSWGSCWRKRCLAGGVLGLLFAVLTVKLLVAELSTDGPIHFLTAGLDWPVLFFGLGLSVITGLLFGLYPVREGQNPRWPRHSKTNPGSLLEPGARHACASCWSVRR